MRGFWLFVQVAVATVLPQALVAATGKPAAGSYTAIELTRFEVARNVRFPEDYQVSLMDDLADQLENTDRFEEVLRPGEQPLHSGAPTLKLSGTVTRFTAGSQALRYLVSFGAGTTRIVARVRIADRATGQVLLERKMDGKVIVGAMGGESMEATQGLAKEVAKVVKREFFAGVPAPAARNYTLRTESPFWWGEVPLRPGEYRLRVVGSRVVLRDHLGQTLLRARVRVEKADKKFLANEVYGVVRHTAEGNACHPIVAIALGGTDTRLVLE